MDFECGKVKICHILVKITVIDFNLVDAQSNVHMQETCPVGLINRKGSQMEISG